MVLNPQESFERAERLFESGRLDEAEKKYSELLGDVNWAVDVNNQLGVITGVQGRLAESRRYFERAVNLDAGRIDIRQNFVLTLERLGLRDEALDQFLDIGVIQFAHGNNQGAIDAFSRGLAFRPGYPRAWINLAAALEADYQFGAALELALSNLMASSRRMKNEIKLIQDFFKEYSSEYNLSAHKNNVNFPIDNRDMASVINTLGNIARHTGRAELASLAYALARELMPENPMIRQNLGQMQLSNANFEEGWNNYEARIGIFSSIPPRNFLQPLWQNESLKGKILLVWAEQGFGDTIQMLRYVPALASQAARILLEVPAELARLAFNCFVSLGNVEVIPRSSESYRALVDGSFDFHCPLMSVPHRLSIRLEHINGEPYMIAMPNDMWRWGGWLNSKFTKGMLRIGIAWAGRPTHTRDRVRSLNIDQFGPLLHKEGVSWVSLQLNLGREKVVLPSGVDIIDITECLSDFGETSALISQLDGIVSVDTAVVHLAGALGIPTAVILPAVPDWRWLFGREDSPWYESLTLFRRSDDGPITSVLLESVSKWLDKLRRNKVVTSKRKPSKK